MTKTPPRAPVIDLSAPDANIPLDQISGIDIQADQPLANIGTNPAITAAAKFLPAGVYFNMSFEDYLDIPYLNASGIKDLMVCLTDYWANSPLNSMDAEEDDDTKAKREGRAFHKRILEGRAAFNASYAPVYRLPDGLTGVLHTNKDIEKRLKEWGIKGYSGKVKAELIAMLRGAEPGALIYDEMEQDWRTQFPTHEFLDEKTMRYIELINKMVESHPDLQQWFAGGYPEVTVIFEAFGILFKCRFDYMKIGFIADLKTFSNIMRKSIRAAINSAMRSYSYHIQATLYLMAADAAQDLIRAGAVHGFDGDPEWLADYVATPVEDFRYAFLKKGNAPAVQPAIFKRDPDSGYDEGMSVITEAVRLYKHGHAIFGKDLPWLHIEAPIILQVSEYIWR